MLLLVNDNNLPEYKHFIVRLQFTPGFTVFLTVTSTATESAIAVLRREMYTFQKPQRLDVPVLRDGPN